MRILCLIFFIFLFSSCYLEDFEDSGMQPIYATIDQLNEIGNMEAQAIQNSGPIYLIGDFFFMTEHKKGIHVFDIADEEQQEALTFLAIPAITDFTIDGTYLYADSWRDLVTIDISDLYNIQLLSRQEGLIDPILYPPFYNGPFECIEESMGAVIGWEETEIEFDHTNYCHTTN